MTTTIVDTEKTLHATMSKKLILLMSLACGMAVANLYYNQPLLADIGRSFDATAQQIGNIAMFTQFGYAVGMFLFAQRALSRARCACIWARQILSKSKKQ
jgi:hypothetical protein